MAVPALRCRRRRDRGRRGADGAPGRPPIGGSILPIYAVIQLDSLVDTLEQQGWTIEARAIGTPEGPAAVLHDTSGNLIALLQVDRPAAMESAYASPDNVHAVRPEPPASPVD